MKLRLLVLILCFLFSRLRIIYNCFLEEFFDAQKRFPCVHESEDIPSLAAIPEYIQPIINLFDVAAGSLREQSRGSKARNLLFSVFKIRSDFLKHQNLITFLR